MPDKCTLASWDDVNLSLAEIGELEREITDIETKMQADIDAAKLAADVAADPYKKRIAALELQIKMYTEEHAVDMGGKKTKALTFGQVGYRRSTKVLLPRAAAKVAELIRTLKARGMGDCVVAPPEKIDKEALKKYPANEITAAGAGLKIEDVFWYEVDKERLAEGAASGR
jgi:phage host-nuclease inhibitor protein Gam